MSNTIIKKVLTLVLLTATGPEVFDATMTTFIFDYYDALEKIINHTNSLNLKNYQERMLQIAV